jgi:hypothetical protein
VDRGNAGTERICFHAWLAYYQGLYTAPVYPTKETRGAEKRSLTAAMLKQLYAYAPKGKTGYTQRL